MSQEQQSAPALPPNIVAIEPAGPCKKKVIIEIPEATIKNASDKQYETFRREAIVPGFRKGRAPRRLLEKRFGKEAAEQIKLKLLADASDAAVKDNKIDVLRDPDIVLEKIELPAAGPMKFDFEVEVRPEFELPALEGVPVNRTKLKVTDDQIAKEIEQVQKWSGMWTPRQNGKIEIDDQVIAEVILKIDGAEEEKLDNIGINVRHNGSVGAVPVEKLDELLLGAKVDDVRQTSIDVPKTYFKEEYRGKKVDVKITVRDIKWLKPAPMDENLFKRLGVENENQLRDKVSASLLSRLEQQSQNEMAGQIYKYMLDNTNFDLPLDIVADQAETLLRRQYINLLRQGLTREQVEEHIEQLKAGSEQQAKEQLKTFFIMDKVAEKLGITVSEEEINGYIAQLAVQQGHRPERVRDEMVRDGSLTQFKLEVREEKCIAKLLESAKIADVEPKEKETKETQKPKKVAKTAGKTEKETHKKPVRKKVVDKKTDK